MAKYTFILFVGLVAGEIKFQTIRGMPRMVYLCILVANFCVFLFTEKCALLFTDYTVGKQPELYELFKIALENENTSPQYLVITVTDTNDNTTKEICTLAPFLEGALHSELSISYDSAGTRKVRRLALQSLERTFQFKSKKALKNIGFYEYPNKDTLLNYWNSIELTDYEQYKSNDLYGLLHFGTAKKDEQLMFAHFMFMNGILTGNSDVTGELYFGNLNKLYPAPGN